MFVSGQGIVLRWQGHSIIGQSLRFSEESGSSSRVFAGDVLHPIPIPVSTLKKHTQESGDHLSPGWA